MLLSPLFTKDNVNAIDGHFGSHFGSHLEYLENGTSDNDYYQIFEFCDPQNPKLEYKNMPIAPLLAKI